MQKLKAFSVQLEGNLKALEQQNAELTQRFLALQTDKETVRLEARELGYWNKDEMVWKLQGKTKEGLTLPQTRIMEYDFVQSYRDDFFRWMFLLLALTSFLVLTFMDQRENAGVRPKGNNPSGVFKSARVP